MKSFQKSYWVK